MMRVIGLGAGGHAKVLIDILRQCGQHEIIGLLDPRKTGQIIAGVPVLGGDEQLGRLRADGVEGAFIGVGSVGDNTVRIRLYHTAIQANFAIINAIHPTASLASSVQLGQGVTIMAGAILGADATAGDNVIINTGAIVEHDCQVSMHAHISPGAVLCGGVRIGQGAYVGAGATMRQYVVIGDQALVGAGAVVVKDIPPYAMAVGIPAKVVKFRDR